MVLKIKLYLFDDSKKMVEALKDAGNEGVKFIMVENMMYGLIPINA
jgi:hypothetical protein